MDIYNKENKLFEKWEKAFTLNGDLGFCRDGLIFNGKCTQNENGGFWNTESGNQEELWHSANRKILFFMKEPNNNPDNDYREWGLEGNTSKPFFKLIYSWLNGLTKVKADDDQPLPITYTFPKEQPLVIVNAKKASGGSTADDNLVYVHADKYKALLKDQLDIYSPNIIVCGGGYTCKTKEIKCITL